VIDLQSVHNTSALNCFSTIFECKFDDLFPKPDSSPGQKLFPPFEEETCSLILIGALVHLQQSGRSDDNEVDPGTRRSRPPPDSSPHV